MGIFRKSKTNTLTAAEVSALWLQYLGDSMAICVYKYFLNIVENNEIKPILEFALQLAESHISPVSNPFHLNNSYPFSAIKSVASMTTVLFTPGTLLS